MLRAGMRVGRGPRPRFSGGAMRSQKRRCALHCGDPFDSVRAGSSKTATGGARIMPQRLKPRSLFRG